MKKNVVEAENGNVMRQNAPRFQEGSLNQEGSVSDVEWRRRVLRRVNAGRGCLGCLLRPGERNPVDRNRHRCDEGSMNGRQRAWSLRRDHVLAAIVSLVHGIAAHLPAALHRLLIEGHGVAVGELQEEHDADGHNERCNLPKHQPVTMRVAFLILGLHEPRGKFGRERPSENARDRLRPPVRARHAPTPVNCSAAIRICASLFHIGARG